MSQLSAYIVPLCIMAIILTALIKKVPVFDEFLAGAKEGLISGAKVIPALVALVTAVSVLKSSGALQTLVDSIRPALSKVGFPAEVIPLAIMRPISGSGALAVMNDILNTSGPDSYAGRVASVMMGSTETTFYTIAVYYGSVGIKKLGNTIPAALAADITGFVASALYVTLFMH